jgi:hypothetical protein
VPRGPAAAVAVLAAACAACGGGGHHPAATPARASATPSATSTPAAAARASGKPGWGRQASYVGRYRLLEGDAADDGQLTLFLRTVFPGQPAVPSGIMALHGSAQGTDLFYLTDLVHDGGRHSAALHAGSFDGPVVGSLSDVTTAGGRLGAAVQLSGRTLQVRFRRFSADPHP